MPPLESLRSRSPAGRVWVEELLETVHEHVKGERELLEAYVELAEEGPDHVRYLIELILDDESRHHRLLGEMANKLESGIEWRPIEPAIPFVQSKRADRPRLSEATARFLEFEREDARALRKLRKEFRPMRNTTLYDLLLRLMELDTKKHIAILEFIQKTAGPPR